jgi:hypothetical protein
MSDVYVRISTDNSNWVPPEHKPISLPLQQSAQLLPTSLGVYDPAYSTEVTSIVNGKRGGGGGWRKECLSQGKSRNCFSVSRATGTDIVSKLANENVKYSTVSSHHRRLFNM